MSDCHIFKFCLEIDLNELILGLLLADALGLNNNQDAQSSSFAANYEQLRQQLAEQLAKTVPVAYSADGRTFNYEVPIGFPLTIGSYITLTVGDNINYFGIITDQEVIEREVAEIGYKVEGTSASLIVARVSADAQIKDRVRTRLAGDKQTTETGQTGRKRRKVAPVRQIFSEH